MQIIALNRIIVGLTGEDHVVIHDNLVASAAARPQNLFLYEGVTDIVKLGVRLIEAIGKNHCFAQGNKRMAYHAGIAFMVANGFDPRIQDTQQAGEMVEAVILGTRSAEELEALFRG